MLPGVRPGATEPIEILNPRRFPHGDDEATADRELLFERLGHVWPAGGDHDRVEWRIFWPTPCSVTLSDLHVGIAQIATALGGGARKTRVPFDAVHLGGDPTGHRRGVPRARSHVEHSIVLSELQCLEHEGDDVWLRDRLLLIDRERGIFVSEFDERVWYEFLTRDFRHRMENALAADSPGDELPFDHFLLRSA